MSVYTSSRINPEIEIVVAHSNNLVIGYKGGIPWPHNKEDMKHFRKLTLGKNCVMGRKTWESILKANPEAKPHQPLKDRNCIMLSKNGLPFNSVERLWFTVGKLMIIGGEQIYKEFLPVASKLHITRILGDYPGDTFFPEYRNGDWECIAEEGKPGLRFLTYVRSKTGRLI
jgi:dihydrofolate reductase